MAQPFTLICPIGIPGSGKTALCKLLHEQLGYPIISVDTIEVDNRKHPQRLEKIKELLTAFLRFRGLPTDKIKNAITLPNYLDALDEGKGSFHGAIEILIKDERFLGMTTTKELFLEIEEALWMPSCSLFLDEAIKDANRGGVHYVCYDLGARHLTELLRVRATYQTIVVHCDSGPDDVWRIWQGELYLYGEIKSDDLSLCVRSNFKKKLFELTDSKTPDEARHVIAPEDEKEQSDKLAEIDAMFDELEEFVTGTLTDRHNTIQAFINLHPEITSDPTTITIQNNGKLDQFNQQVLQHF